MKKKKFFFVFQKRCFVEKLKTKTRNKKTRKQENKMGGKEEKRGIVERFFASNQLAVRAGVYPILFSMLICPIISYQLHWSSVIQTHCEKFDVKNFVPSMSAVIGNEEPGFFFLFFCFFFFFFLILLFFLFFFFSFLSILFGSFFLLLLTLL